MTTEQQMSQLIKNTSEISALWESSKSAHKRIDENDRIVKGVHKLAANMEALAIQMKMLTDKLDETIDKVEESQRRQGERLGSVEAVCLSVERQESVLVRLDARIEALEKEPADKWKDLVKQIIALVIAAVAGVLTGKFTK